VKPPLKVPPTSAVVAAVDQGRQLPVARVGYIFVPATAFFKGVHLIGIVVFSL